MKCKMSFDLTRAIKKAVATITNASSIMHFQFQYL